MVYLVRSFVLSLTVLFSFLNIITELIAGYIWPGKPIANMFVKVYGYNSVKHGMDFAQDLKLGQYMVGQTPLPF